MNSGRNIQPPVSGLSLVDIYFVVFRHKWKIVILTLLGMAAAAAYYSLKQPPFESQADLLIRYVSEKYEPNLKTDPGASSVVDLGESVMNDEANMISSLDLATIVATNVGPALILAKVGGGDDPLRAASVIKNGLKVEASRGSSVIRITFSHPDQTVVKPVTQAIIDAYREMSHEVHSANGMSDDLLTEQTAVLHAQMSQTEQELLIAKTNAGVIDFATAEKYYSDQSSRMQGELLQAQAELAEQQAVQSQITGIPNRIDPLTNSVAPTNVPDDQLTKYKTVCGKLAYLQARYHDYLFVQGYTAENRLVKETAAGMKDAAAIKSDLEEKYPSLATLALDATPTGLIATGTPTSAGSQGLESLPTRVQTLKKQLEQIHSDAIKLEQAGAKINELEHQKEVQEGNLKYYETTLQQQKFEENLGPGQVSNIKPIQTPTPPFKDYKKFRSTVTALFFSGLLVGLAWAFIIEMFLDRSIKRPIEVQTKLKIPFFLSIPDLSQGNSKRSMPANRQLGYNANTVNGQGPNPAKTAKAEALEVVQWEINRRFNSYYDALRDRLVVYFESINLTRKPKLVAITSTHKGSGVSTIAAGLAASLSETGDGRVLLVDMNNENGAAQQFFRGEASCRLDDALTSDKRDSAMVQDNLYVVTEDTISDKLPRALPRRFASLIPKLKASDYDYIIFDMPPVSPTSVTSRLAGFMDTVMLVIESEKTDQQVVQQANALLAQSKANVTAVLNKTKHYIPSRLHQDFLSDI